MRPCWSRRARPSVPRDRKSTRLNSSHLVISYAVFCLKKKKNSHLNHSPRPPCDEQYCEELLILVHFLFALKCLLHPLASRSVNAPICRSTALYARCM